MYVLSRAVLQPASVAPGVIWAGQAAGLIGAALRPQRQRFFMTQTPVLLKVVTFRLADIGEGIAEVAVQQWSKQPGDHVEEMDVVCTAESDKATVEISSPFTGAIKKLYHEVGSTVKIGAPLMDIEVDEQDDGAAADSPAVTDSAADLEKATSTQDKTSSALATPSSGKQSSCRNSPSINFPSRGASKQTESSGTEAPVSTAPWIRMLAQSCELDLRDVQRETGAKTVTPQDLYAYLRKRLSASSTPEASAAEVPQSSIVQKQLGPVGRAMAQTMSEAVKQPRMNIAEEVDMTNLLRLRKRSSASHSITAYIVKAVSLALEAESQVNSKYLGDSQEVIEYRHHDVNIAMDTPSGLLVPVIRNVERKSVLTIAEDLQNLKQLVAKNKLSPADNSVGSITLSNFGTIGGVYGHTINYKEQAAIVGVGRTRLLPRYRDEEDLSLVLTKHLEPEPQAIANISVSADHRHLDGATVCRFLAKLKRILEHPASVF